MDGALAGASPPPGVVAQLAQQATLSPALLAFTSLAHEALAFGIPAAVLPKLPVPLTEAGVRAAHRHLLGMIASFQSAAL